jgi:hypothetical protein
LRAQASSRIVRRDPRRRAQIGGFEHLKTGSFPQCFPQERWRGVGTFQPAVERDAV